MDHRIKHGDRQKMMRLAADELIQRFLIRTLLEVPQSASSPGPAAAPKPLTLREPCRCCSAPMRIIEIIRRGQTRRSRTPPQEQAA